MATNMPISLDMPLRIAWRPVRRAARDGVQTGEGTYICSKSTPLAARASTFGVGREVLPKQPISPYPRSSTRRITILGSSPPTREEALQVADSHAKRANSSSCVALFTRPRAMRGSLSLCFDLMRQKLIWPTSILRLSFSCRKDNSWNFRIWTEHFRDLRRNLKKNDSEFRRLSRLPVTTSPAAVGRTFWNLESSVEKIATLLFRILIL